MDGGQKRSVDQPAVGKGEEVEAVVDEVELAGPLENGGNMERLLYLGVEASVL